MKIEDYLKKQKTNISNKQRLVIFEQVNSAITKQSIFTRFSFYAKVALYSIFLFFLFLWIFLPNFQTTNVNVSKNIALNSKIENNVVHADYIGKVISSKGDFQIFDNNRVVKWLTLKEWNIIVLKNNSYVKALIDGDIKVYLLWPAKVQVNMYKQEKWKPVYILNVLDGNYLTLKSNNSDNKIIIKSKYFNIESDKKLVDLVYKEKEGVNIVENNGSNILIKNDKKILNLSKKEAVLLTKNEKTYIENLLSDSYVKYTLTQSGDLKKILSSSDIKKVWKTLDRVKIILATWKYVLWKVNNNKNMETSWLKSMIDITLNTYTNLDLALPADIVKMIATEKYSVDVEKKLLTNLINQINKKYILPNIYPQRLRIMLAYIVIADKIKQKYPNKKFENLSQILNYLKIEKKYKKILLRF